MGKAAAALLALGGVEEVFADVISRPALDLLEKMRSAPVTGFACRISSTVRIPAGVRWKPVATDCKRPKSAWHR